MNGTLRGPKDAKSIQVLVHGLSYAQYYWDLPYQPDGYSYPRAANHRDYATLAKDRLGIGQSWHPARLSGTSERRSNSTSHMILPFLS